MVFVDSNIPMYLVGQAQSKRFEAQALVEQAVIRCERLNTSW
jgi:hypothetical protein